MNRKNKIQIAGVFFVLGFALLVLPFSEVQQEEANRFEGRTTKIQNPVREQPNLQGVREEKIRAFKKGGVETESRVTRVSPSGVSLNPFFGQNLATRLREEYVAKQLQELAQVAPLSPQQRVALAEKARDTFESQQVFQGKERIQWYVKEYEDILGKEAAERYEAMLLARFEQENRNRANRVMARMERLQLDENQRESVREILLDEYPRLLNELPRDESPGAFLRVNQQRHQILSEVLEPVLTEKQLEQFHAQEASPVARKVRSMLF